MRHIKRNQLLICIPVIILCAPIMLFWWKEPCMHPFKPGNETTNPSFPLHTNSMRKLEKAKLQFKWGSPIWNDDTTSKDLEPRLQNLKKYFLKLNMYNVTLPEKSMRWKHYPSDLLCMLKNVNMEMVKQTDFSALDSNLSMHIPTTPIWDVVGNLKRCAVVSSSAAMNRSKLGSEIDGHDAVLRFNSAPTKGFEEDVGDKTTLRLFNSQVLTLPDFKFLNQQLYRMGILIMWDPAPYNATLQEWYKKPEFDFWKNYKAYRKKNPEQPFYIINPFSLWRVWDIIQANTLEDIHPNPPSSGMTGIMIMMNLCDEVNVYEYLPSRRKTNLCHYFEKSRNSACMLGGYHPVTFEKNLIKQLNQGTDENIFYHGKVTLPGFNKVKC